jgi:hypothetical protein
VKLDGLRQPCGLDPALSRLLLVFLDVTVTPPRMQRIHVKKEINISAAAIDSFVKTPRVLGAWQDQLQEYPPQHEQKMSLESLLQ